MLPVSAGASPPAAAAAAPTLQPEPTELPSADADELQAAQLMRKDAAESEVVQLLLLPADQRTLALPSAPSLLLGGGGGSRLRWPSQSSMSIYVC